MSIWINEDSKVLVQGITGGQGTFHATRMTEYGTDVVGGVTPGKGGQVVDLPGRSVPVYDAMGQAVSETNADVSVIYVPAMRLAPSDPQVQHYNASTRVCNKEPVRQLAATHVQ